MDIETAKRAAKILDIIADLEWKIEKLDESTCARFFDGKGYNLTEIYKSSDVGKCIFESAKDSYRKELDKLNKELESL